jgi:hypothetical protein
VWRPSRWRRRTAPPLREYVSICGFSSVGKKTLIRKLVNGQLRDRFVMPGSVQAYGWAFEPLEDIYDATADHVLYQWQIATDNLIDELHDRFPASGHRVILVWRPWDQHLADWIATYGDEMVGQPSIGVLTDWWRDVIIPRFRNDLAGRGWPVEIVNGASPGYERLDWQTVDRLADEADPRRHEGR